MRILEELSGCLTIGISGHEHPDGDCVGACLGLALYLRKNMPLARVDVFLEDPPGDLRRNVPGADTLITDFRTDVDSYDAFVVLDSASDRIAGAEAFFEAAKKTINIDHHISNPGCGTVNYVDGNASSACELVYDTLDPDRMDREIAQALYVGMVTDTGCFRFSNTSRKTMETAGKLITFGFEYPRIVREVYFEKTWVQQRMLGKALIKSKSHVGGRCIVSRLNQESIRSLGGQGKDVEGIVAALATTAGADCAIFAHEKADGNWRVSLRSNKIVNVSEIAGQYGGGGHYHASGCTVRPDQEISAELRRMVEMARAQLEEYDRKKQEQVGSTCTTEC